MVRTRKHRSTRFNLQRLETRMAPAVVTNSNDSGSGSLRSAISSTNGSSSDDVITFDPVYFNVPRTITLTSGQLNISDTLHIQGPGDDKLTVSGGSVSRVFNISGSDTPQIILSGMRIANGKVAGSGAGVRNQGEWLSLINCTLSNNVATGASGGAVSSIGGTLNLSGCKVTGNSAGANGGGVDANSGAAVAIGTSTIAGNVAASQGGGIGVGSSNLVIDRSTVSGNSANGGGGLYFAGTTTGTGLTLRNSTFSGNTAGQNGGAVHLSNFGGTLVVQSCTITANTAKSLAGGIYQTSTGTGAIAIESTVLSDNTANVYADVANFAHPATLKYSALGSKSGFTYSDVGGNLPVGIDLHLLPLSSSGETSKTHMLMPISPAIDAGSNPSSATYDQRGVGNPRVVNARSDIGAWESQYLVVTNANNSGPGSLRQVVADANAIAGVDAPTFDLAYFSVPRTITLTGGEILISDAIVIHGPGAAKATVSGNNDSRVFRVEAGGSIFATINKLTISNGRVIGRGAGVLNNGETVTLYDCVVSNNDSVIKSSGGGAVASVGGSLTLDRCRITGNYSSTNGGGVDANSGATVTIRDCTIADNVAVGQGGGIGIGSSSLIIERTTVSGNTANGGGGLYFAGAVGAGGLTIRNSTFSDNVAKADGGGINLTSFSGTCTVRNSTITANSAAAFGGGVDVNASGAATVALQSSIVQGNYAVSGPDVYSPTTVAATRCALGSINGIATLSNLGGNLIGQDIKLGTLADNGGPTLTHVLLPGSPCIDAGYNPGLLSIDQRGFERLVGANLDIGSVEMQLTVPTITSLKVNDGSAQRSRITSLTVDFSEAVAFSNGLPAAFQLVRTGPGGATGAVNLNFVTTADSVVITFANGGAVNPEAGGSLPDGEYQLKVLGAAVNGAMAYLDGNDDGVAGGDRIELFHRLFGDADGDRDVDTSDFAGFRTAYGNVNNAFDYDNDGDVDTSDYAQFRGRFGTAI